uniref:Peptide-methionine (S)-S-oxide reductase n=1 Tax=Macrostomum lignano TaxID=282301 RepID=A0A1I8FME5_9PLAT
MPYNSGQQELASGPKKLRVNTAGCLWGAEFSLWAAKLDLSSLLKNRSQIAAEFHLFAQGDSSDRICQVERMSYMLSMLLSLMFVPVASELHFNL